MNKIIDFIIKEHLRAALIVIAIVVAFIATWDTEHEKTQTAMYCEMVKIHKETGGELGWPPYKGKDQCN